MKVFELRDMLTMLALIVSAVMMTFGAIQLWRGGRSSHDEDRDRLIRIEEATTSTDRRLARIEAKMDDHAGRITSLEARAADIDRRVERIEHRCDDRVVAATE